MPRLSGPWSDQEVVGDVSTIAFAALAASACRSLPSLAPKRLSSRAKRARYAAPVLVVLASWSLPDSCYTADRPEPAPPEIKQVDIIPQTVFVTPGKQFTLQVRLLDQDNGVLPETGEPAVTWSWAPLPGLKQVSANAQSVVLEAGDVASGNTLSVSLNASVGTSHGIGTVVVVGPTAVVFRHQLTWPLRGGLTRSVFSSPPAMSGRPSPSRSTARASCVPT